MFKVWTGKKRLTKETLSINLVNPINQEKKRIKECQNKGGCYMIPWLFYIHHLTQSSNNFNCLSLFSSCHNKILWENNSRERGFTLAPNSRSRPPLQGRQDSESLQKPVTMHMPSREEWTPLPSPFSPLYSVQGLLLKEWPHPQQTVLPASIKQLR